MPLPCVWACAGFGQGLALATRAFKPTVCTRAAGLVPISMHAPGKPPATRLVRAPIARNSKSNRTPMRFITRSHILRACSTLHRLSPTPHANTTASSTISTATQLQHAGSAFARRQHPGIAACHGHTHNHSITAPLHHHRSATQTAQQQHQIGNSTAARPQRQQRNSSTSCTNAA